MQTIYQNLYQSGGQIIRGDELHPNEGAAYEEFITWHDEDCRYIATMVHPGKSFKFNVEELEASREASVEHKAELRIEHMESRL